MKISLFLLLMALSLILQATVLDYVSIWGVKPDLVLLLAIFNGFHLGTREGAFLGFISGIIEDLFSGSYIGLNALSKMVAGCVAGEAGQRFYRENVIVAAGVTFFSSIAGLFVNYLLLLFLSINLPPFYAVFRIILPTAFYTAVLVLLFFGRVSHFIVFKRDF